MELIYGIPSFKTKRASYVVFKESMFNLLDVEPIYPLFYNEYTDSVIMTFNQLLGDFSDAEIRKILQISTLHLNENEKVLEHILKHIKPVKYDGETNEVVKYKGKVLSFEFSQGSYAETDVIRITPLFKFPVDPIAIYYKTNTKHVLNMLNKYLGRYVSADGQTYYNYTFSTRNYGTCAMSITPLNAKDKKTPAVKALEAYFDGLKNVTSELKLNPVLETMEDSYLNKRVDNYLKYKDGLRDAIVYLSNNIYEFHIEYQSSDVIAYKAIVKYFEDK